MSDDEKVVAIGRLILERKDAREQEPLLRDELQTLSKRFDEIGLCLSNPVKAENADQAAQSLRKLSESGGLDHVRSRLTEYRLLLDRIRDLTAKLQEAGAES